MLVRAVNLFMVMIREFRKKIMDLIRGGRLADFEHFSTSLLFFITTPLGEEITRELMCSLSLDRMEDPVLANDGNLYDRVYITEHLRRQNTSPLTGLVMLSNNLFQCLFAKRILERLNKIDEN